MHSDCIGLAIVPEGEWFCEECQVKNNKCDESDMGDGIKGMSVRDSIQPFGRLAFDDNRITELNVILDELKERRGLSTTVKKARVKSESSIDNEPRVFHFETLLRVGQKDNGYSAFFDVQALHSQVPSAAEFKDDESLSLLSPMAKENGRMTNNSLSFDENKLVPKSLSRILTKSHKRKNERNTFSFRNEIKPKHVHLPNLPFAQADNRIKRSRILGTYSVSKDVYTIIPRTFPSPLKLCTQIERDDFDSFFQVNNQTIKPLKSKVRRRHAFE
jgi:hypothetical protein